MNYSSFNLNLDDFNLLQFFVGIDPTFQLCELYLGAKNTKAQKLLNCALTLFNNFILSQNPHSYGSFLWLRDRSSFFISSSSLSFNNCSFSLRFPSTASANATANVLVTTFEMGSRSR